MPNRTDEAKLVHFMVHGLGMRVELDGSYWLDGTLMSAESKPDFALDEAQMGRVWDAMNRVTGGYYVISRVGPNDVYARAKDHTASAPTEQSAAFALVLAVTGFKDEKVRR